MSAPPPSAGFRWDLTASGPVLRCLALDGTARHGFTSRQLQLRTDVPGGWDRVAAVVGCAADGVRRVRQVHGAAVRVVDREAADAASETDAPPAADALVTNLSGTAVAVVTADCVSILLADPQTGAVGAVHAGWRGTAANVAAATVQAMRERFAVDPARLVAAIGPSIGACCYDVGEELPDAFAAAGHAPEAVARWFARDGAGRLRLDLWTANRDLLAGAGLRAEHVHVAGLCTKTHLDWFESYRAEGTQAGRMAAIIVAP